MMKSPYFVLKPVGVKGHAIASRNALRAYARTIRRYDPAKASEIEAEVERLAGQARQSGARIRRVPDGQAGRSSR